MKNGIKRITKDGFIVPNSWEPGKRFEWLTSIIKQHGFTEGAEIGCKRGNTTAYLLSHCPDLQLIVVDLWSKEGGVQYRKLNFQDIKRTFYRKTSAFRNRLTVYVGVSWEVADQVKDESLDFVFIDADHEYESVKKDILAWAPKVRPGGLITGHDTHFEGVMKALKELIPNYKEAGIDHCWFIKKEDYGER